MSRGSEYGRLFERLPLVAYVADLGERVRLRYVSPYVEELLGYPALDWLGESPLFGERLHPDDRDRVLAVIGRVTTSGDASAGEFRMLARDGRTVWLADRRIAAESADGARRVAGVLEDVTARKEAERELAHSRRVSAAVLESLGEGLLVLDRAGQVISANRKAARILGVDAGELQARGIHRPVVDAYLEDGTPLDEDNSLAMRVLREGVDERDVPIRLVRPDGSETWVSANYLLLRDAVDESPRGVIWSLVDITESRRVAHELAESEGRFRDVVENVQAVFWIRDIRNSEIVYLGRRTRRCGGARWKRPTATRTRGSTRFIRPTARPRSRRFSRARPTSTTSSTESSVPTGRSAGSTTARSRCAGRSAAARSSPGWPRT
jgi:PAS domain S-box-containing protein